MNTTNDSRCAMTQRGPSKMRFILPAAAMNDETRVFMRVLPRWVIGLVLTLLMLFFMADMFSRAYNLTWFPWQIQITDQHEPQSRSGAA